jgi:hypothetical protein
MQGALAKFADAVSAIQFEDISTRPYGKFYLDFVPYEFGACGALGGIP